MAFILRLLLHLLVRLPSNDDDITEFVNIRGDRAAVASKQEGSVDGRLEDVSHWSLHYSASAGLHRLSHSPKPGSSKLPLSVNGEDGGAHY